MKTSQIITLACVAMLSCLQAFSFENNTPMPPKHADPYSENKVKTPHVLINNLPIFEKTPPSVLLNVWGQRPDAENKLFNTASKFFEEDQANTFANILAKEEMQQALSEAGWQISGGPMLGNISEDGISVWVRTIKPSTVKVIATNPKGKKISAEAQSTLESDYSAVVKLQGLTPETKYTYELFVDGENITFADLDLSFHTPTKAHSDINGRIVFGSCFHRWGLGNMKQAEAIIERDADALLFIGDIAVQDRRNRISFHCQDYFLRDMYPAWRKMIAKYPVYASWDDHDYIWNDRSGADTEIGVDVPTRHKIRKVFENAWANPYYGTGKDGIYTHTTIGPADIIMTDNRYFRENKKGSFLGDEQMEWLKKTLLECKSPFKIISCGTMWSDYVSEGKDSWGVNDPEGRDELFKFIMDNNITGVLLISGDRHGARGFAIPMNDNFSFYEFNGASLGGRWGPAATMAKWTTQLYGIALEYAFSEFNFGGTKKNPTVEFNLIGEDGDIKFNRTFTYDELTPKK